MIRNDILLDKFIRWVIFKPILATIVIYGVLTLISTIYVVNKSDCDCVIGIAEFVSIWFVFCLVFGLFHFLLFSISAFNDDFFDYFYGTDEYYNGKYVSTLQYKYLKKLKDLQYEKQLKDLEYDKK